MASKRRAQAASTRTRRSERGYACGNNTQQKILESAIQVFGEQGFEATTTRQIAARAEVNLALLQYYFGKKEDLYRACAEYIADAVEPGVAATIADANAPADLPRDALIQVLEKFLGQFIDHLDDGIGKADWKNFTARAERENSVAFEILHARIFSKTIAAAHLLFCRITGCAPEDIDARVAVFSLVGSLSFFRSSRLFVLRSLGWQNYAGKHLDIIRANLRRQLLISLDQFSARRAPGRSAGKSLRARTRPRSRRGEPHTTRAS